MTCSKCHCYFCWLCLKKLIKSDPYSHFNNANSECFAKLFEGTFTQDNNQEDEIANFDQNDDDEDDEDEDDDDIIFIRNFEQQMQMLNGQL